MLLYQETKSGGVENEGIKAVFLHLSYFFSLPF